MGLKALHRTKIGAHPNEGARLLWAHIRKFALTISDLRRDVGTQPGMLNRWAWCDTRPTIPWATVLEDKLGIPMRAWQQKPSGRIQPRYRTAKEAAAEVAP